MAAPQSRKIPFRFFLVIVVLLSLPDLIFLFRERLFHDLLLHLIMAVCFYLIPVYFFKNHLKLYYWLLIPFIFFSSLIFSCILFFNIRVTPEVLLAVVNTNFREAEEFSRAYIVIYLLILIVILLFYILLIRRLPAKLPGRRAAVVTGTAIMIFLLLPFFQRDDDTYVNRMKTVAFNTFPASLIHDAAKVVSMYRSINSNAATRANFTFHAVQVSPPAARQLYILIIGESGRSSQWQINGYPRPTSPRLLKRTNLFTLPNTVSGGYVTEYAVPLIISQATPDNFEIQNRQKSIVGAFKEAGFKTYWMSNNLDYGHIQMHAKEGDEYIFDIESKKLDMDIIDRELKKILVKNEPKVFIVIHTLGSHWAYSERYPPAFEMFKPVEKFIDVSLSVSRKKESLINAYDNSILYTDAVIDSVISLTDQTNACSSVWYIADHGEDLMDDSKLKITHGSDPPSVYVARIPFFMWYSDEYKNRYPEKLEWLQKNRERKTGAENVFPSLADMAHLRFPDLDSSKSVLNAGFKDSQQKILGGDSKVYNYADLLKNAQ